MYCEGTRLINYIFCPRISVHHVYHFYWRGSEVGYTPPAVTLYWRGQLLHPLSLSIYFTLYCRGQLLSSFLSLAASLLSVFFPSPAIGFLSLLRVEHALVLSSRSNFSLSHSLSTSTLCHYQFTSHFTAEGGYDSTLCHYQITGTTGGVVVFPESTTGVEPLLNGQVCVCVCVCVCARAITRARAHTHTHTRHGSLGCASCTQPSRARGCATTPTCVRSTLSGIHLMIVRHTCC